MDHEFTGPSFTIGVEEELMIVDQETLNLLEVMSEIVAATAA
jgi:gamma-glutamyl:cysteine ligase YbdK (ATP-grasp superfamily)